jgi:murein L,D-transpeptidase YcbB/YkuD
MPQTRWVQLLLLLALAGGLPGLALGETPTVGSGPLQIQLNYPSQGTVPTLPYDQSAGQAVRGGSTPASQATPAQASQPEAPQSLQTAEPDGPLRARLADIAVQPRPTLAPGLPKVVLASAPVLLEFYRQRGNDRVWQRQGQVDALLSAIARSPEEGLAPADFHEHAILQALGDKGLAGLQGEARDEADLLLSDSLLRYIHHRLFGKVDPVAIDRKLNYTDPAAIEDLLTQLGAALDAPDLEDHLTYLVREPVFYTRLKEGLAKFRAAEARGGWGKIPAGPKLAQGARDGRVIALRTRLRAGGEYLWPDPADPKLFDADLKAAVMAFQKGHGLPADGVVGGQTLVELNVPVERRIEQIRVNLERMRWVYRDLPEDHLLVDIVGFQVHVMQGPEVLWSTKAQVGRPDRQTPTFRDQVEYLELNPTWTVPPTILKDDILPKARVNPGYVAKKGLKAIDRNGRSVPLSAVNWNHPAGSFPYTLRQDGGGQKAALGQIKFIFPNRFSVYLHDTPSRALFARPVRMTSSGCVRVDRPFELAERVLGQPERYSVASLKDLVATGKTRTVRLKQPLDIILSYWTAEGLGQGGVRFRGDVYGRDAAVLAALDAPARPRVKLPPPPEPAQVPEAVPASEPDPQTTPGASPGGPPAPRPTEAEKAPAPPVHEPEVAASAGVLPRPSL